MLHASPPTAAASNPNDETTMPTPLCAMTTCDDCQDELPCQVYEVRGLTVDYTVRKVWCGGCADANLVYAVDEECSWESVAQPLPI